jgi:hypothetical protein
MKHKTKITDKIEKIFLYKVLIPFGPFKKDEILSLDSTLNSVKIALKNQWIIEVNEDIQDM